ncbi:MAG: NAD(P)/FAD-dependent oxidoreductase [Clostridia bacterium]|nr:NAD(P)/FAD-dependent oxidoreductase [Clostridia bacterium]
MKKYIIIGNGTAAVGCIEGIRSIDKTGEITVISEENHPVYSRPLISYYLENKTDSERMKYRGDNFYKDNGCRVIYGKKAVKISKTSVMLDNETVLKGDKILVAAGSRPFVPPIAGLDTVEKKFGFMTLDDALALEKVLSKDARVLIVGAGLIGLKCAEGIHDRVGSITVCDLADRVLSSILDSDCAGVVQKHLEANKIKFLLGDTVERFDGNKAFMKSGKQVNFDILVLAVGVRANSELIKIAGGKVNRGIIVNSKMETSLPHIYAAGDCSEGFDSSIGAARVLAILPNAYIGGFTAGVNMAGGEATFGNAIPMNSIGFFGLHIMSAGDYSGVCSEERTDNTLKRFFTKDGYLRGFILIGATERAGIYTALIRDKTPLKTIDFDLTKKVASNLIFSKKIRGKKFGGVV